MPVESSTEQTFPQSSCLPPPLFDEYTSEQADGRAREQVSHTNRQINFALFATVSGEVMESFEILPLVSHSLRLPRVSLKDIYQLAARRLAIIQSICLST